MNFIPVIIWFGTSVCVVRADHTSRMKPTFSSPSYKSAQLQESLNKISDVTQNVSEIAIKAHNKATSLLHHFMDNLLYQALYNRRQMARMLSEEYIDCKEINSMVHSIQTLRSKCLFNISESLMKELETGKMIKNSTEGMIKILKEAKPYCTKSDVTFKTCEGKIRFVEEELLKLQHSFETYSHQEFTEASFPQQLLIDMDCFRLEEKFTYPNSLIHHYRRLIERCERKFFVF